MKRFATVVLFLFAVSGFFCVPLDSLLQVIAQGKNDTNTALAHHSVCWYYMNRGDFNNAKKYCDSSLALSKKIRYVKGESWALNAIGSIYRNQGNFQDALNSYFASLRMRKQLKNQLEMAYCYANIGITYKLMGKPAEALQYYLLTLQISEREGDEATEGIALNNIGELYRTQKNFKEALRYFDKSVKLRQKIRDEKGIASCHNNIGAVYVELKQFDICLEHFMLAMEYYKKVGRKTGVALISQNIGAVYEELLKKNDGGNAAQYRKEALNHYLQSLQIYEELGDTMSQADVKIKMGVHFTVTREFSKAEDFLNWSERVLERSGNIILLSECLSAKADLYEGKKDFRKAHQYYKKYIVCRDSVTNSETQKKIMQQQVRYEYDQKTAIERAAQEKAALKNAEERRKQQLVINFTVGGLLIVLFLAAIILRSLILNKKKNKIIVEQKKIVEEQKRIVELKQKEILDSIHYAKRIQSSLLPGERYIARLLGKRNK